MTSIPLEKPTAAQVKTAREAAGLTQSACAALFGYAPRTWQGKEDAGPGNRGLSVGEYAYLLLLAGAHPTYQLQWRENAGSGKVLSDEQITQAVQLAKVKCVHPDAATTIDIGRAVLAFAAARPKDAASASNLEPSDLPPVALRTVADPSAPYSLEVTQNDHETRLHVWVRHGADFSFAVPVEHPDAEALRQFSGILSVSPPGLPKAWRQAIAAVRARFSVEHFPADGQSVECQSARMVRIACSNIQSRIESALAEQPIEPAEPKFLTTDESRDYLLDFMKRNFADKTFARYIQGNLAGDFAWHMARALRMLPGSENTAIDVPSEDRTE